jgi:hypothetical protein
MCKGTESGRIQCDKPNISNIPQTVSFVGPWGKTTGEVINYCPNCMKPYWPTMFSDPPQELCECYKFESPFKGIEFVPMGWECPRCHQINGPYVQQCTCVPTIVTTTGGSISDSGT